MRWTLAASVGEPSTVARTTIGRGLAGAEVVRQRDRRLAALDARRQDRRIGDALAEPEERRAEDEQERQGRDQDRDGTGHDRVRHALPARLAGDVGRLADGPAERPPDPIAQSGHAARVDARPEHAQDRRQERQREEHGRGHGERSTDAERAQGGRLEQEQPGQADRDREPGEGHGLAARGDGDLDRGGDVPALAQLLAEAADHEQRVVDGEGQAEHRRDVLDVDRELGHLGGEVDAAEGRRDRQGGDDQGQAGGDERREDEDEDEGGERERDGLRLDQLLLRLLGLVLGRRRHARQQEGQVRGLVDQGAQLAPSRRPRPRR